MCISKMGRVDTGKEVLRLYREILRTSRRFHWKNEQGEEWCVSCGRICGDRIASWMRSSLTLFVNFVVVGQVESAAKECAIGNRRRAL